MTRKKHVEDKKIVINIESIDKIEPRPEIGLTDILTRSGERFIVTNDEAEEIKSLLLGKGNTENKEIRELVTVVNRLILSIDRLGVRIPSSIKIHP